MEVNLTSVPHDAQAQILDAVQSHQVHVRHANQLLAIPFVTVTEYLFLMSETARLVEPLHHRALFYLAATVSDFYIPDDQLPEHKGSSSRSRQADAWQRLEWHQVPEFLGYFKTKGAPDAFFVSLTNGPLETDVALVRRKAQQSMEKDGMHLVVVVANELLDTRSNQVLLIQSDGNECAIHQPTDSQVDREQSIVQTVVHAHYRYLAKMLPHFQGSSKVELDAYQGGSAFWYHPTVLWLQHFWCSHQHEILSMVLGSAMSILVNMARQKLLDH